MLDLKPSISLAPTQLGVKTPSVGLAKLLHGVEKSKYQKVNTYKPNFLIDFSSGVLLSGRNTHSLNAIQPLAE